MKYKCQICKDDGLCLDNPSHKDYEINNKDVWSGTDLCDCMDYHDKYIKKDGVSWITRWVKNINEKLKGFLLNFIGLSGLLIWCGPVK